MGTSYRLEFTNPNVTLRSLSGNRDTVIIDAGYSSTGAAEIIYINAKNITITDLTLRHAWYHPVHVVGDADGAILYNLKIIDGAEQFIKINPEGTNYADKGLIACSYLELTDTGSTHVRNNCYTGGIDGHSVQGWIVRDNEFKGFYCRDGSGLAEHAIHFWSQSRDTIVERNIIINSARE